MLGPGYGTEGREGGHPLYTENQPKPLLDASFPNPPAPSQLQAQILAPSTSCGQEEDEDVGDGGTLCLRLLCPGELLTQPALKSQSESGGREVQVQAGRQLCPLPPLLLLRPAPHMRLQLLARSLCISPSFPFPRSGRPAS